MYSHVNARASLESALLRYADLRRAVGEARGDLHEQSSPAPSPTTRECPEDLLASLI